MGTLVRVGTSEELRLFPHHRIGRAATNDLVLADQGVSGDHAVIAWSGRDWTVRDLGSRNGTLVGGEKITGTARPLGRGKLVAFGSPRCQWVLQDASAPVARAMDLGSDEEREADDGLLLLPPNGAVFELGAQWMFEAEGTARAVADGETVVLDGRPWRLRLPTGLPATLAAVELPLTLDSLTLWFSVSRDEEHVTWWATAGSERVELGDRAFNYTLLTLARQRLAEAEHGESEAGWVDREQLLRMLALEPDTLRVHLYRARKALAAAGVQDAAGLIARRSSAGQLRINTGALEVSRS
jgi:hypothetical protein